jgi:hypothetical protein
MSTKHEAARIGIVDFFESSSSGDCALNSQFYRRLSAFQSDMFKYSHVFAYGYKICADLGRTNEVGGAVVCWKLGEGGGKIFVC